MKSQIIDKKILKKSYKILALSLAIFILSLIFVFWRMGFWSPEKENRGKDQFRVTPLSHGFSFGSGVSESKIEISNFPPPENFSTFSYPEKKSLEIKTKCADAYYAILIFSQAEDYRQNPASAKFNKALPCQLGEKIEYQIDLTTLNLTQGKYYYFVADQGKVGNWYNPR